MILQSTSIFLARYYHETKHWSIFSYSSSYALVESHAFSVKWLRYIEEMDKKLNDLCQSFSNGSLVISAL